MYTRILNRKIHFKKFGSGTPMIFIHGWGGNIYSLHKLATLASKQHTSYLIDLPGFGKSDNPPKHWGIEGYAILINEFIEHEKLKKPHIIGHAFGSDVAVYLASHYPKNLGKLICCSCSFRRELKISQPARFLKKISRHHWLTKTIYPHIKSLYYRIFHKDSDILRYPHLEANFRKIISQDLTSELDNIKNKTLILWGENDICTPAIMAYEMNKKIKFSKLCVFPDLSHSFPVKKPKIVWTEIKPFLLT